MRFSGRSMCGAALATAAAFLTHAQPLAAQALRGFTYCAPPSRPAASIRPPPHSRWPLVMKKCSSLQKWFFAIGSVSKEKRNAPFEKPMTRSRSGDVVGRDEVPQLTSTATDAARSTVIYDVTRIVTRALNARRMASIASISLSQGIFLRAAQASEARSFVRRSARASPIPTARLRRSKASKVSGAKMATPGRMRSIAPSSRRFSPTAPLGPR